MESTNTTARRAGALYFIFMIVAIVGEFLLPSYQVPGDAAATAQNIVSSGLPYRLSILIGLLTHFLFIFLVVTLYKLFREVDLWHATLMVLLVSIGVSVAFANVIYRFAPLVLLDGSGYLSVFTKPQLDALAMGSLRLHRAGLAVTMAFWGLWLFPFGMLVIKSGFFPRVLGVLLMVAGFGYLTSSVVSILLPEFRQMVFKVMMPLYFGEVPIIFWMLIKGAGVPTPHPRAPLAG